MAAHEDERARERRAFVFERGCAVRRFVAPFADRVSGFTASPADCPLCPLLFRPGIAIKAAITPLCRGQQNMRIEAVSVVLTASIRCAAEYESCRTK